MIGLPVGKNKSKLSNKVLAGLVGALALSAIVFSGILPSSSTQQPNYTPQCPIVEIYRPSSYEENKPVLNKIINDEVFRNESVKKMQGAVQIDTSSYDNRPLDVGANLDQFTQFDEFEDYLSKTFPLFYENTQLHKVNYHGLVFIWEGTDSDLKPLLLMGHQDVVPINNDSLSQWDYPPFEAHYDGKYLYGRGSGDCKNLVIGQLEAAEELIKTGFKPRRTVIFSYGFDEEITGIRNQNAQFIEEIFGAKSLYAVMDEGGVSLTDSEGVTMAVVGTGEKGYMDLKVSIQKKGGHSSVPQDHTAIGFMGEIIVQIENNKFPTYFTESNPTYWQYMCLAENSVDIDRTLKRDILMSKFDETSNKRVRDFINGDRLTSYAIKTTQALDIINGGVKSNALPEYVELVINSRVTLEENIEIAFKKFVYDVKKVASENNLGLTVNYPSGKTESFNEESEIGLLTIEPITILEPSFVTPVGDAKWKIFAGSLRHVYEDLAYPNKDPVLVTPGLGTGNTDTKLYWNLTDHIYRYRPGVLPSVTANSHGINEYIEFDGHLQIIAFTFEYILSVDAAED
ncbi:Gly-Xaa carboxypeptidase [Martiniozyma asiatica (nom. inval.)]|nr:Gly-Xaa carboxypeptidase [Martiniozyma asiatica]